jgi:hypothetical protein
MRRFSPAAMHGSNEPFPTVLPEAAGDTTGWPRGGKGVEKRSAGKSREFTAKGSELYAKA